MYADDELQTSLSKATEAAYSAALARSGPPTVVDAAIAFKTPQTAAQALATAQSLGVTDVDQIRGTFEPGSRPVYGEDYPADALLPSQQIAQIYVHQLEMTQENITDYQAELADGEPETADEAEGLNATLAQQQRMQQSLASGGGFITSISARMPVNLLSV